MEKALHPVTALAWDDVACATGLSCYHTASGGSLMLPITALIHTRNDADWLGRTLESLQPCDEFLVVDHGSQDDTLRVAREYGASILQSEHWDASALLRQARHDWIVSLLPNETLTEGLEASLFEWKLASHSAAEAFAVETREEREGAWVSLGLSIRLLNRRGQPWTGVLPPAREPAAALDGVLLRFAKS
jgi:hypothetical protein